MFTSLSLIVPCSDWLSSHNAVSGMQATESKLEQFCMTWYTCEVRVFVAAEVELHRLGCWQVHPANHSGVAALCRTVGGNVLYRPWWLVALMLTMRCEAVTL